MKILLEWLCLRLILPPLPPGYLQLLTAPLGAALNRILDIEIIKWNEYFNPKRDQKSYTWLRLNNDIFTDPKLFGLDSEQRACWIEILCQTSKKSTGEVTINLDQIADLLKVKIAKVEKLIDFLVATAIIKVHDRARSHFVVEPTVELQNTTPTNDTNDTNERKGPDADDSAPPPFGEILKTKPVNTNVQQGWIETYKDPTWIEFELRKAINWTLVRKNRAPKSDFARFFNSWLSKAWEDHRKTLGREKPVITI